MPPFTKASGGVRVAVRVAPRAARDAVQGMDAARGALKVAVTAPPDRGKANEAVIKLLARQWKVPKSTISVASGAAARDKVLHVAGDPDEIFTRLTEWAETDAKG